jgi:putative glutamine amidotransferase
LSASKPLIGVTTYRQPGTTGVWSGEFAMIPGDYLEGVERAGGTIVLLPPQGLDAEGAARVVAGLDGVMLCGGRDVEPARYGQEPLETTEQSDTRRDNTEDLVLGAAIAAGLPILGICRGAQMLNVHRGGTLIQHVPDVVGDTRYQRGGGEYTMMDVSLVEGTALHALYNGSTSVGPCAMYHHQAIDQVGSGMVVSAWSPDGLIEAVELENYPFGVAVQWHPEKTLDDLTLFEALISAATTYRKKN